MIHPAPPCLRRKAARMVRVAKTTIVILMMVTILVPPVIVVSGAGPGNVDVLLFFDDSQYFWINVEASQNALCATIAACSASGIHLNYSMSQYGAFVTGIGGHDAPPDFSWWWEVLFWNDTNAAWQEAPVGASDLKVAAGDFICWCPSSSVPPTPNPLTKYPWAQFRGNSNNTGFSIAEAPFRPDMFWAIDLGNGPVDSTPAVADGRVFISTGGVYNWTSMSYEKPPHLYSLDESTGKVVWSTETTAAGWQVSSPAVKAGKVYIGTSDGMVMAFSENDGKHLWKFSTGASDTGVTSSPLVAGSTIYVTAGDARLYAISLDGIELWNFSLGGPAYMTTPALAAGKLLAGSDNGTLWCLALNGTPLWNHSVDGKIRTSPAVSGDVAYFISTVYDGWTAVRSYLHSVNISTGLSIWPRPVSIDASTSSPATDGNRIFIASGSNISAIDKNGIGLWTKNAGGPVQASITTDGVRICYGTNIQNSTMNARDVDNGVEKWEFMPAPPQYLLSSAALADGKLFFGSDNGKVYCIGQYNESYQPPLSSHGIISCWTIFISFALLAMAALVAWEYTDLPIQKRWRPDDKK